MSFNRITTRIAATALAGALTLGGLMGVAVFSADDHQVNTSAEETAAGVKVSVSFNRGGASAQGATWS